MSDSFESILDESISALQAGVPVEEILAEVPEYAGELRPLLYAATVLANPNPQLASEAQKSALRDKYMTQIAALPAPTHPSTGQKLQAVMSIMRRRLTPKAVLSDLTTVAITVILTLLMAVFILSYAAQDTLPGDFLYGVKRGSEAVQFYFTSGQADRFELARQFNQRRLAELDQLMQQNRTAVVGFRGVLENKGEHLWIIAGYTVLVPDDVTIKGDPEEGTEVEVAGFLRANQVLVADVISTIK